MPSVISGDANVSATEFGYLDGVTSGLQSQIDSKLNLAGGKILQIVRATDSTNRSTTSTSFVDMTGMSVTITPQRSNSAVLLWFTFNAQLAGTTSNNYAQYRIADSSNNAISGTNVNYVGTFNYTITGTADFGMQVHLLAYATPATTSATTYKLRAQVGATTTNLILKNFDWGIGQMYAIEVSA